MPRDEAPLPHLLLAMPMRVGAEWLALLEANVPADHAAPGA